MYFVLLSFDSIFDIWCVVRIFEWVRFVFFLFKWMNELNCINGRKIDDAEHKKDNNHLVIVRFGLF